MSTRLSARDWLLSLCGCVLILFTTLARAQSDASQRSFPKSKAEIEKALAAIKNNMAGRLPVLEGFAQPAEHPLDRYRRGYYQATAEVLSEQSGGCGQKDELPGNLFAVHSQDDDLDLPVVDGRAGRLLRDHDLVADVPAHRA